MGIKERLEGRTTFSSVAGVMKGRTKYIFFLTKGTVLHKKLFLQKGKI